MIQICDDLFLHPSHQPNLDRKGVSLSADSPYNQNVSINIQRCAYLRQHFGMNYKSSNPAADVRNRFTYGTGDGTKTVGTPPFHFSTRPFNHHMKIISSAIQKFIKKEYAQDSMKVSTLTHMTVVSYYQRRKVKPNSCQLDYHRDVSYTSDGKYNEFKNSQSFNTPTIVLCIGQSRTLKFRNCCACYSNRRSTPSSSIREFKLNHGDMFVLHPDDERPSMRNKKDTTINTFFQHGDVRLNSDGFSIGLAFRSSHHIMSVRNDTGIPHMPCLKYAKLLCKYHRNHFRMQEYVADQSQKRTDDEKIRTEYLRTKHRFLEY